MNDQRKPVRVDLHCHSTASAAGRRALALPECVSPPEEVYELAKRRGMDFVTITDHNTIAGVEQIADRPDVFFSEAQASGLPVLALESAGAAEQLAEIYRAARAETPAARTELPHAA